jgi:hypothetical protein
MFYGKNLKNLSSTPSFPENFLVNIKIDVKHSNYNDTGHQLVPATHEGPRRVLLERIDHQLQEINDCNNRVHFLTEQAIELKKESDECVIQSYAAILKRNQECEKAMEEASRIESMLRSNYYLLSWEFHQLRKNLSTLSASNTSMTERVASLQTQLEKCNHQLLSMSSSFDKLSVESQKSINTSESNLRFCLSRNANDSRTIASQIGEISSLELGKLACNESLSICEAGRASQSRNNAVLLDTVERLNSSVGQQAAELATAKDKAWTLEKSLSLLRIEMMKGKDEPAAAPDSGKTAQSIDVVQVAQPVTLTRSALFLYSMLLLLLGYFIREFKLVTNTPAPAPATNILTAVEVVADNTTANSSCSQPPESKFPSFNGGSAVTFSSYSNGKYDYSLI